MKGSETTMDKQKNKTKLLIVGLLLSILMSAMDNTIVATAMGTIVGELGGLDQFVWVTSAYMVASMAAMPIFGKLSDMFGRKRFFIFGLTVFLIGSILCGTAESIVQLSIYRAIQGIGGGALMPIAFTIVFDAFPMEKRGKMTALLGATFGISSVFGPLLGAYITDAVGWNWIFYINVPIGLVALFIIATAYHESKEHVKQKIDWGGAVTLVGAIVSFMFAIELGGKEYDWNSVQILSLFGAFAILFIAFIFIERKAKDPIISFSLFKNKLFSSSQALAFLYGGAFIALTVFIPIFVQAVTGGTAKNAGFILMPMMIGTVVGSGIVGAYLPKTTFRKLMMYSLISFIIGLVLLGQMTPDTPNWMLSSFMFIAGFGTGFSFSLLPQSTMHKLSVTQRGSANSTNAFFRSLGMTIGVTIWGSIQSSAFQNKLTETFGNDSDMGAMPQDTSNLFAEGVREQIPPEVLDAIINTMASSITSVFQYATILLVVAIPFVWMMGKEKATNE